MSVSPQSSGAEWERLNLPVLLGLNLVFSVGESVIYHPFWVVKTHVQLHGAMTTSAPVDTASSARAFIAERGYRGLWRGVIPSVIVTTPTYLLFLVGYHKIKHVMMGSDNATIRNIAPAAAAVISEAACLGFHIPMDVVVQRMQLPNSPKRAIDVAKITAKEFGFRGIYRGTSLTSMNYALGTGMWWYSYESFKVLIQGPNGPDTPSVFSLPAFGAGLGSGAMTTVLLNPLDVIKTRIQTLQGEKAYSTFFGAVREIARIEGVGGFWKGLTYRMVSRVPLSAGSSVIYEFTLQSSLNY